MLRLQLPAEIKPALKHFLRKTLFQQPESIADNSQFSRVGSRVGSHQCFSLLKGGQRLIEPFLSIQKVSQFVKFLNQDLLACAGWNRLKNLFCLTELAALAFKPGVDKFCRTVVVVRTQSTFHILRGFVESVAQLTDFRKLNEYFRRRVILFDRPPEKTLSHVMFVEIEAPHPSSFERFGFIWRHTDRPFETSFGRLIVVGLPVNCCKVQQGAAVGGIHPTGAFHDFSALLKITTLPKIGRGLHHSRKRAVGNQSLSLQFHRCYSIIKTARVRASSLLRLGVPLVRWQAKFRHVIQAFEPE
ncbi:MAG TPA: hypothetical protein VHC44_05375 [Verrucomicrobiae bacterium]|nr:hypothetical protein [Verrucomicrobiae bacterium]